MRFSQINIAVDIKKVIGKTVRLADGKVMPSTISRIELTLARLLIFWSGFLLIS